MILTFKEFLLESSIPEKVKVGTRFKPTRNSEGKFISNSVESIINFWNWFGTSKMLDSQKRPIVFYHGTQKNFNKFSTGGDSINQMRSSLGHYFSEDRELVGMYAGGDGGNVMPVYLKITKPKEMTMHQIDEIAVSDRNGMVNLRKSLISKGIDGVIIPEVKPDHAMGEDGSPKEYIVFDASNIKSALGNKGTFDPDSTDINESRD